MSLTKVYDGKNLLVNQFSSKQEVIDVSSSLMIDNHGVDDARLGDTRKCIYPCVLGVAASPLPGNQGHRWRIQRQLPHTGLSGEKLINR